MASSQDGEGERNETVYSGCLPSLSASWRKLLHANKDNNSKNGEKKRQRKNQAFLVCDAHARSFFQTPNRPTSFQFRCSPVSMSILR